MKKFLLKALVPAFLAVGLVGCVEPPAEKPVPEWCKEASCENTPLPELSGVFVSGHLGNYWDCPEEGYQSEGNVDGGAPLAGDVAEGACAPDTECEPILNCEAASMMINVSNVGDAEAQGLQVDRIELYNDDGELVAELPVIAVFESAATFDGLVSEEETVNLTIDFQGPVDPYTLLTTTDSNGDRSFDSSGSGTIRVVFSADRHAEFKVEGKEIYAVPATAT